MCAAGEGIHQKTPCGQKTPLSESEGHEQEVKGMSVSPCKYQDLSLVGCALVGGGSCASLQGKIDVNERWTTACPVRQAVPSFGGHWLVITPGFSGGHLLQVPVHLLEVVVCADVYFPFTDQAKTASSLQLLAEWLICVLGEAPPWLHPDLIPGLLTGKTNTFPFYLCSSLLHTICL